MVSNTSLCLPSALILFSLAKASARTSDVPPVSGLPSPKSQKLIDCERDWRKIRELESTYADLPRGGGEVNERQHASALLFAWR
jgi:hypothetical protein